MGGSAVVQAVGVLTDLSVLLSLPPFQKQLTRTSRNLFPLSDATAQPWKGSFEGAPPTSLGCLPSSTRGCDRGGGEEFVARQAKKGCGGGGEEE